MESPVVGSDLPDSPAATLELRESSLMRGVNSNLRHASDSFAHSDPIIFFCECRTPGCYSPIPMSSEAFDRTVANARGWLLIEGHEPSTPWEPPEPFPARVITGSMDRTHAAGLGRPWLIALCRVSSSRLRLASGNQQEREEGSRC